MSINTLNPHRFNPSQSKSRVTHPPPVTEPPPPGPPHRQADLLYFTDIDPSPVEWLWQDRLAAGSVAVLSGDPGAGKTWVALAIAAALSRGQAPGAPSAEAT